MLLRISRFIFCTVIVLVFFSSCTSNCNFKIEKIHDIIISESLQKEPAIDLATGDLSNTIVDLFDSKTSVKTIGDLKNVTPNSILIIKDKDISLVREIEKVIGVVIPKLAEDGFIIKTVCYENNPFILIVGEGVRGASYGTFHFIEQLKLNHSFTSKSIDILREPDMTWRMITQPFEALGYQEVAKLPKPITQHINREFDPQRPWEGAGYDPEDEAKNILRTGLNAVWVGNFSFATDYSNYDPTIFPENSEGRKWISERQQKIAQVMAAAKKYHLKTVASSDIFIYPKGQDSSKKWDLLEYSLNEFMTRFPEIDMITTRFGENYSYYNKFFSGAPLEGKSIESQFHKIIDFIHKIVSDKYGKIYMPRTWACGNATWGSNADHYNNVISKVKAEENIIFSIKNTRTDFWRYNIYNPIIGTGDKEQAIEFLCQDGYHFKNAIPYYDVNRMANGATEFGENKGMKYAYDKGARTVWGWLSADGWCGPYIKREEWLRANIYGFSQLSWDVNRDPKQLAKEWAAIEFGVEVDSEVADNISEIMMLSEPMIIKSRYFKNYCMKHEGWLPANNWMRDELIGGGMRSNNRLSKGKSFAPGTLKPIFNPATIEEDIQEKIEAYVLMNTMVEKFDAIREQIPDKRKAEEVYNTLLYGKYLIGTIRYYVSGMFRYYNGEYEKAVVDLREWKKCWDFYNNEIPKLPGTATLILDGGMVETCNEAMKDMDMSY